MVSLDYTFYKDFSMTCYVTDADFTKYLRRARLFIDNYTYNRVGVLSDTSNSVVVEAVKCCLCDVIDKLYMYSKDDNKVKSSESVGPWSVNYSESSLPKSAMMDIHNTVDFYLEVHNLTYMGL